MRDDNDDARHQRFVIDIGNRQTLLIAHNIDLAPRVPLSTGDTVTVRGQYEWNDRGGLLHWPHADPDGQRRDTGWIRHRGQLYQ